MLNITKVDAILRSGQVFEKDGVHLMAKSGLKFVTDLIGMAEAAFDAEVCEVNEDDNIFSKIVSAGKDSASQSRFSCENLMSTRRSTGRRRTEPWSWVWTSQRTLRGQGKVKAKNKEVG